MNDPSSSVTLLPPAPTGRRARATYEQLIAGAERLLSTGGFDAMTSTAVAEAAGVSTGTFYAYFADRHAILAALFGRCLDDLVDRVDGVLTADHLLDLGLRVTLRRAVDLVIEGYRDRAHVLRPALARVPLRPELRALYWDRHQRATAVVERFLRRGAAAGLIRRDGHAAAAQAVLLITQGLNHPVLTDAGGRTAAAIRDEIAGALTAVLAPG